MRGKPKQNNIKSGAKERKAQQRRDEAKQRQAEFDALSADEKETRNKNHNGKYRT